MKLKSLIAALLAAGMAVSAAHAGSTVNPNIPAIRDPLNSPPIQQNFQATFNDISNILGKFASNTAPTNPTAFQEWANTSTSPVVVFNYWNAGTATWVPFGTLNTATGVFSSFSVTGGFLRTAPITVSVSGGVVTYGLATDGNFATVGGNLAFAPIANGSLLARCTGASGEPTACTWPTFAAQAIGATNGIFPHFVGGVWTTDTTGTSGHAVPFLDASNLWSAPQTTYPGTATLRAPLTGMVERGAQLDGTAPVSQLDSFGAAGAFSCMRSDGTAAASTALAANDLICAFGAHGYDGVANSTVAAAFRLYASQGWTSTAHGTYARVATSANGTTSPVDQFGVEQDGGLTAPPTVMGGSKGAGTLNVGTGYFINGNAFSAANLAGIGTGVAAAIDNPLNGANGLVGFSGNIGAASGTSLALSGALSASGTVSGTGFSAFLASPPPIGGTAPAAITGTTITGATYVGLPVGTNAAEGVLKCDGATTNCVGGVISASGGVATAIDAAGATSITNGTSGCALVDNAGKVGCGNGIAYTGQVTNRIYAPNTLGPVSTATQCMARSYHVAKDNLTSIKIAWAGWAVLTSDSTPTGTGQETAASAALTVSASVEFPVGTFTQVLFSGSANGSIATGATLFSDATTVSIPEGSQFFVRTYLRSSGSSGNGMPFLGPGTVTSPTYNAGGEALDCATSVTNQTLSGTVTANIPNADIYPVAIVGTTTKPCFFIAGDSIGMGSGDTIDQSGDAGPIARSLQGKYAYINMAVQGDLASFAKTNYAKRGALVQFCKNAISEYGVNDVFVGLSTQSQLQSDLGTVWGILATDGASKIFQSTITPETTSTDGWATPINQALLSSAQNTVRNAVNAYVRQVPAPLTGFLEIANQIELVNGVGLWNAPGGGEPYTADGIHPNNFGIMKMVSPQTSLISP
jgi:hypothetical protein